MKQHDLQHTDYKAFSKENALVVERRSKRRSPKTYLVQLLMAKSGHNATGLKKLQKSSFTRLFLKYYKNGDNMTVKNATNCDHL
jgi:hypothetical protein